MKILITDLTRMYSGHICAAGIDIDSGARVRPVLRTRVGEDPRLNGALIASKGGPLNIGSIIDFGPCVPCGSPPEIEDVWFELDNVRPFRRLTIDEFLAALRPIASPDLLTAFGSELVQIGGSLATPKGKGRCSLAIILTSRVPIIVNQWGKISAHLEGRWRPVTDVRLHAGDLITPNHAAVSELHRVSVSAGEVLLSVGLARAWLRPGATEEWHYFQINNVHVRDWKNWRLAPP